MEEGSSIDAAVREGWIGATGAWPIAYCAAYGKERNMARVGGQKIASRDTPELISTLEPLVPPDSAP